MELLVVMIAATAVMLVARFVRVLVGRTENADH